MIGGYGCRFFLELAQIAVLMTRKKSARSPLQLAKWTIGAHLPTRALNLTGVRLKAQLFVARRMSAA